MDPDERTSLSLLDCGGGAVAPLEDRAEEVENNEGELLR
jgi:hypothetical protein